MSSFAFASSHHNLAVTDNDSQAKDIGICYQAPALTFCVCGLFFSRTKTHVYPLTVTTAAAASSWLTLSARRPCSSTETKLPSEVRTREAPVDPSLLTLHLW